LNKHFLFLIKYIKLIFINNKNIKAKRKLINDNIYNNNIMIEI